MTDNYLVKEAGRPEPVATGKIGPERGREAKKLILRHTLPEQQVSR